MPASETSGGSGGRGAMEPYGVIATRHYESGPPASKLQLSTLDDGEVYETVKEEEWLTRKKVTTTTTKEVETRTQRQVVLEDGEVVEDSGPIVTTDCKEDTVTNEVTADENLKPEGQEGGIDEPPGDGWVPVPGAVVVSEKTQHIVNSHQVAQNRRETEEVTHCGNVTNKEVEDHVDGQADLRALTDARQAGGWELARPERRVVHESTKKWGNIDTEDVRETSRVQDGHVVTETERTTQHEEYDNESVPDSGSSLSDGSVHEEARETQHNIVHTKDEDLVEYYAVPRGGTLAQGVKLGEGMHVVSEDFHEDREGEELDSLSERVRRARRLKPKPRETPERTDALTRRPLDYHQEEETRKSETNRWLENHFGSESGRSRSSSSHHDLEDDSVHTAGGNVITITMSPRPATPEDVAEDVPGAAPASMLRWGNTPLAPPPPSKVAPPPPPPPKPTVTWSPPAPATANNTAHHKQSKSQEEITDSMIVAARAKLRSTGRILSDSDQGTPPTSPPAINGTKTSIERVPSSRGNVSSPPVSPTGVNGRSPDDPVFSSRFRSGSPAGLVSSRFFSTPSRNSRQSPPDSPPPPLPSTPPPPTTNVGRSQSFNVTTNSWLNKSNSTPSSRLLESRRKEYRSEEQLDAVGHKPTKRWPPPPRDPSPEPPRETTPPPPPRHRHSRASTNNISHYNTAPARSSRRSSKVELSTQTDAKDSATQTGPSPVPPPRTKRKNKPNITAPKTTYYFGQDSSSSTSESNRVRTPVNATSSSTMSYTRTTKDSRSSPKVERRFRTEKTITPIVVVASPISNHVDRSSSKNLHNKSWHYRSMDELSSRLENGTPPASWTNTVDPRRRPRRYEEDTKEPVTRTLPKKMLVNGSPSPSKTYIYGGDSGSERSRPGSVSSSHLRRSQGGSMVNVSLAGMSSPTPKSPVSVDPPSRTSKHVSRSHSLNVKPAPLSTLSPAPAPSFPSSSLSNHQRTSAMYKSTPYLRSPNLIATIARSNSTRRTEEDEVNRASPAPERRRWSSNNSRNSNENSNRLGPAMTNGDTKGEEEKRHRFMKGLLTAAPELYHFMHGDEEGKQGNTSPNPPESPPQLIRPPGSPLTSPNAPPAAKVFTFGRGENSSLKRNSSFSQDNNRFSSLGRNRETHTTSYGDSTTTTNQRNSLSSQYHRNAMLNSTTDGTTSLNRPRFNLKSSGGSSLLYSPSFRNRQEQSSSGPNSLNRRGSDEYQSPSLRWRDQESLGGKSSGKVTSNITRDGAVLIPVRDWNSR